MSASQKKPWKRFIKRDMLQGGGRGKVTSVPFRGEAAYVKRLRRLEVVVLTLTMKLKLEPRALDRLLEDMLALADEQGAEPGSGSPDTRGAFPLSHSGPADGQAEGEADS